MEAENQESPAAHCAVGRQDAGKPPKSSIMTLLSHAACVSEEPVRPMKRLKLHEADGGCGYAGVRQPVPESLKSDFRDVPCGLLAAVFESSHFNVTQTRSLMKKLVEEEQEVQQVRCSRKRTHAGRQIPEDAFSREPQAIVEGVLDCTSAEHRHSVLAQMIMQQMVSSNSQQAATEVLTQFLKAFERRVSHQTTLHAVDAFGAIARRARPRHSQSCSAVIGSGSNEAKERHRVNAGRASPKGRDAIGGRARVAKTAGGKRTLGVSSVRA